MQDCCHSFLNYPITYVAFGDYYQKELQHTISNADIWLKNRYALIFSFASFHLYIDQDSGWVESYLIQPWICHYGKKANVYRENFFWVLEKILDSAASFKNNQLKLI